MQFGRVAMLYYPDCNCRVTVRHFCTEIAQARGLLQVLQYTSRPPRLCRAGWRSGPRLAGSKVKQSSLDDVYCVKLKGVK
jgi:hypothetical protein